MASASDEDDIVYPFIAQATEIEVCGEVPDADWLCQLVFRTTENDLLARAARTLSSIVVVLLVLVAAFVVARLLRRSVTRFAGRMERKIEDRLEKAQATGAISDTGRYRTRRLQRLGAIAGVLRGVLGTAVWLTAVLVILSELGVRLQPILAGAGLVGIVIGFGAQQLVRDVIAGIAMLIEDQYGVGDWIDINGVFGMVERVGLRSTAFRDVDGVVHHVLNGTVERVGNLSKEWARSALDVPLALDTDLAAAKLLIFRTANELAEDPIWGQDIIGPPEVWGVQEFGPEGLKIRVVMPTKPLRNWDITRQLRERLKLAFEEADIRMPSRLVELGGQRSGYALLTHEVDADADLRTPRPGLLARDDRPVEHPAGAPAAHDADVAEPERADEGTGDLSTELRIQQGPRARPD